MPGGSDAEWSEGWLNREVAARMQEEAAERRAGAAPGPTLVRPVQLRCPYGAKRRHPAGPFQVSDWATQEEWEREKSHVVLDRLKQPSKTFYQVG